MQNFLAHEIVRTHSIHDLLVPAFIISTTKLRMECQQWSYLTLTSYQFSTGGTLAKRWVGLSKPTEQPQDMGLGSCIFETTLELCNKLTHFCKYSHEEEKMKRTTKCQLVEF